MRSNGSPVQDAGVAALAAEAGHQTELLHRLVDTQRAELSQIAVSDAEPPATVLNDFPVERARRRLVRRTGHGDPGLTIDTNGELICDANVSRMGGLIVNKGAVGVTLYLADKAGAGLPATWLSPNGGSWDFMAGPMFWCGSVFAVADSATTTLTLAEL